MEADGISVSIPLTNSVRAESQICKDTCREVVQGCRI